MNYVINNLQIYKNNKNKILSKKYQNKCFHDNELDFNIFIKTLNSSDGFKNLINDIPNFINKNIKINYIHFNSIVVLCNNFTLTNDNIDDIKFLLNYNKIICYFNDFNIKEDSINIFY